MAEANGIELYTTQKNEHVKKVLVTDLVGRLHKVYATGLQTPVGSPCSVTIYGYVDATSPETECMVEVSGTWTQEHQDKINAILA